MMKEGLLMEKNKTKKILATCLTLTLFYGTYSKFELEGSTACSTTESIIMFNNRQLN